MAFYLSWRLRLPSEFRRDQVHTKLEALRLYCLQLPFERTTPEVRCVHGEALEEERRRGRIRWMWGDLHLPASPGGGKEDDQIEAKEIMSFVVWPGRGAESAWFGVARHPEEDSRAHAETGGKWDGSGFSKTLYSAHPSVGGVPHFMKCHLGLVLALDEARRIGFEATVSDDGGYWESRDVTLLLAKLHEAERRVAKIVGPLTDKMADHVEGFVGAPMRGRADFERLEAGAARPTIPRWDDGIRNLVERAGGQ